MSPADATSELAGAFASRLLTPEVQEMLEPMLGCAQVFFRTASIEKVRAAVIRDDGLTRIIERLEAMLGLISQDQHVDLVAKVGKEDGLAETTFEAMANYCAGIMMVGTAAARCATAIGRTSAQKVYFSGEPVSGAFWRCVGILQAGGLGINDSLGRRLFTQMILSKPSAGPGPRAYSGTVRESSIPLQLAALQRLSGFVPDITSSANDLMMVSVEQLMVNLLYFTANPSRFQVGREDEANSRRMRAIMLEFIAETLINLRDCAEAFNRSGISADYHLISDLTDTDRLIYTLRRMADDPSSPPDGLDREVQYRMRSILEDLNHQHRLASREVSHYGSRRLSALYELLDYPGREYWLRSPSHIEPPSPPPGPQ